MHTRHPRRVRGFTLIEALVALLVLSIGLLGVAALQLTSLRNNSNSALRTQATLLAYDIVDRMRANRFAALNADAYVVAFGDTLDPGTVAGDDVQRWKDLIGQTLPAGDGEIERLAGTNTFVIRIQWDDSRGQEDPLVFALETEI